MTAAEDFLSTYVTSDGRVLRHDQGDDIVSEGQAYGMLIAEQAGQDDVVRTIWSWTRSHLQNSDGLLAFHADATGHVLSPQPAADADTLAAYALLRYSGPDESSLQADGKRVASAVLAHETVHDSGGRPVLAAGPWATGTPPIVNPSYWMPSIFADLGRLTGDRAWTQMAAATVRLTDQGSRHGGRLPPDWGQLDGSDVTPTGSGGGQDSPQYGADAQRVPLWFGYSCGDTAQHLAAAWWTLLQKESRSSASVLSLDGQPLDSSGSTLALLAAAAGARAAGEDSAAVDLEAGAQQSDDGNATYYGAAWLALASGLREGDLGSCPRS